MKEMIFRTSDDGLVMNNASEMELVRCKDCKECYYASNRVPSERTYSCGKHGIDVTLDWFCADGERRMIMTDEEKSKELTRSSFAAQMAMLGYKPNGNPKDMVEVVRCKDCKYWRDGYMDYDIHPWLPCMELETTKDWFCAYGERR